VRAANEALRFLCELTVLTVLGFWGWSVGTTIPSKWILAISAPLAAAVVWGLWVAPRARLRLEDPYRFAVELSVFGAAVAALVVMGRTDLSVILGSVVAANLALLSVWSQR
jgi:hypothetical protein